MLSSRFLKLSWSANWGYRAGFNFFKEVSLVMAGFLIQRLHPETNDRKQHKSSNRVNHMK
jgi:hypothetical protein